MAERHGPVPYDLGPLDEYDEAKSIGMQEARKLVRGKGGRPPSLEGFRRFANPLRGCRPLGPGGPLIVLPTVRVAGELRTMPQWVAAFSKARAEATRRDRISHAVRKKLPR